MGSIGLASPAMKRNMAYGTGGEFGGRKLLIAVHTASAPSDLEWDRWLAFLDENGKQMNGDLARLPNLVFTDGGAPSTAQRTAVNMRIAQGVTLPPVAVVTNSVVVRTILRGLSVFNPGTRAFAPTDLENALTHLDVPLSETKSILQAAKRLEMEIGAGSVSTVDAARS